MFHAPVGPNCPITVYIELRSPILHPEAAGQKKTDIQKDQWSNEKTGRHPGAKRTKKNVAGFSYRFFGYPELTPWIQFFKNKKKLVRSRY